MELKVWVEGIQRIVCGVTESTTCQDVVFALAHATGKIGRFTLIERWRNNERLLAPQEYPLKILMKWGEYSNDIQFILRRSDSTNSAGNSKNNPTVSTGQKNLNGSVNSGHSSSTQTNLDGASSPSGSTATPTYHPSPTNNLVGVVKGVPQNKHTPNDLLNQKDVPPYREPPPPYRSPPPPSQGSCKASTGTTGARTPTQLSHPVKAELSPEAVAYNTQYRELVSLVNYQREKLSNQQADLIKFDAEIGYWETKGREQERQVDGLAQQITSADSQLRITTDQVQMLSYVEEESEAVKQNEKTLKSEQQIMRSKLADCEAELMQLRNKMHRLMDDIQQQKLSNSRHQENRQQLERSIMAEMEGLQNQIQQAKHATDINHLTAETLKREVGVLESAILEKKRQVEQLVQEMKEANLQSLAGSSDELLHVLEGTSKPGSARRIIGSPRQLENAVPTNKNPHGVWV